MSQAEEKTDSAEEQVDPAAVAVELRRFVEDLVIFEGRRFTMPAEALAELEEMKAVPPATSSSAEELERFRQEICDCTRCELGQTRQQFVFGTGDSEAGIMFIGEAPGADEDRQGEPFVGAAGQLLTKIIEAMGMRREEVFICNVLKCRPPNNRDPQPGEVAECEPYLKRQIEIVRPKIICALGRIASQTLLKSTESMGRMRGRLHDYDGIPVLCTYHPAALLHNANWKRPTWEDMKWLRREYDGVEL